MMRSGLLHILLLVSFACVAQAQVQVKLKNPLDIPRTRETVELDWAVLNRIQTFPPESVIVLDEQQHQIVSQVIYAGQKEPQALIFQVDIPAKGETMYSITRGTQEAYPQSAFGRFVPERMDDYAWENNRIAFRVYGPALKDPVSPGVDVWVKSTDQLIINKWYAGKQYHKNSGEGLDCYKVGKTLGAGACAPLRHDSLLLGENFKTWETLDNGPIRTTVRLTYPPVSIGEASASLQKTISLDANSYLNKMENRYTGNFEHIEVAAGVTLHQPTSRNKDKELVWIREPASDSKHPQTDGDIFLAVIFPDAQKMASTPNHLLLVKNVRSGESFVYWSGAGWSQGGIPDTLFWKIYIESARLKLKFPITIVFPIHHNSLNGF